MSGACRPRQMFPPPTTTAICTPMDVTSTSWSARWPVEEHVVLEEGVELARHDAIDDVLGAALLASLALRHAALGGDHVLRDVLPPQPPGLRAGDVQRHVLGQLLELVGVGDEVRLA